MIYNGNECKKIGLYGSFWVEMQKLLLIRSFLDIMIVEVKQDDKTEGISGKTYLLEG